MQNKKFSEESSLSFKDGEIIFEEGEETQEMYIVQQGEIVVFKSTVKGDVELGVIKRGDFFGEMSLLESLPRSASAKARGATQLLAIQPGGFLLKIRRDPSFAFEIMQALSKRIRTTNEKLLEFFQSQKEAHVLPLKKILVDSEFHDHKN